MLDLLTTIYADDTFRFTLWHVLELCNVDGIVSWVIDAAGYTLYEDFSIGG